MRILVYTASSLCNPQLGIQMETAIDYTKKGHEVVFCHCKGVMMACSANPYKNSVLCNICQLGFHQALKCLPSEVKQAGLEKQGEKQRDIRQFNSVADIKAYKYKGVDVGYSVLSVYISKTRDPNPLVDEDFRKCINLLINEAEDLVDAVDDIIISKKPEKIVFFNGRFFDTKPLLNLAMRHNIEFVTTENIGGVRAESEYKIVNFVNTTPHDTRQTVINIQKSWELSPKSDKEKTEIGRGFYEKRRNGIKAGDYVYTSDQIKGKLPDSYDSKKKNVVIYCSSEDEYSSVSAQVDSYFLFKSQYDAIKYLADSINDDSYHFFVRIHPNLKGLNFEYHLKLYKLQSDRITVIAPEDPISSYALMDIAYNVVVFGSTIGAESMYWGKSVVLLGDADYYYWECCSIPLKKEEFVEMVRNPKNYEKAKEMTIKYGYYFLENSLGKSSQHLRITPRSIKILGRNVYVFDYLKIWYSPLLYRLIQTVYTRVFTRFANNKINFPV